MTKLVCGLLLFFSTTLQAQLEVHTDFPGGSGEVVSLDQKTRVVELRPTDHPERGWRCWWHVKLTGLSAGEKVQLKVGDAPWATPDRASFSVDGGETWQHTEKGQREGKQIVYELTGKTDSVLVAWGPPFLPSDASALVAKLAATSVEAAAFTLCRTREGRETPALRVGAEEGQDKPLVWVQARQHAWEAGSSWVAQGLGEWLVSDEAGAVWLRQHCEVVLVPVMDIDNVHRGAGGKNQSPHDHNRDWSDEPHWKSVAAAQALIAKAAAKGKLAAFVDLHNPAAQDLFPFFFLPDPAILSATAKEKQARFLDLAKEEMRGPLRFGGRTVVSGSGYDKNWKNISSSWVARLGTPAIALTLETSWNTPQSTTENYRLIGRQLGQSLARSFMAETALEEKTASPLAAGDPPLNISGVYPHLTMWNDDGECGTGAVVPWQGQLWAVTYSPHRPKGSADKLYQITPDYVQHIFEGSVGGTPANRMIHEESQQLLIGPYLIDQKKQIRVIPPAVMPGRLTGTARHLSDPANKVYYATMEEGLYEVDVNTLEVKCLIQDANGGSPGSAIPSELPGYHGKGLYSGQGRLVYANNGEHGPQVRTDPTVTSGALAQWFGEGDWQLVRRNQFTEVTARGGISGGLTPESDPIWSMGWDAKSLILALLEKGAWHYYRLPKGSHSYDGSHGWNTEWPRIREIGEGENFLATMHGTFWRFPAGFSLAQSAGISPRSNYLKVIADFCRWGDRVVFACDDSAKAEFLNTRSFKAAHGAPLESNSNLWFVDPEKLDHLGPVLGRGSVWLRETLKAGTVSDPYLFSGYDHRQLHLHHEAKTPVNFSLEIDRAGNNQWETLREFSVAGGEALSHVFSETAPEQGAWVRLKINEDAPGVTAHFQYRNEDARPEKKAAIFDGIATVTEAAASTGVMRSLSHDRLGLVAGVGDGMRYYEINKKLEFTAVDDEAAALALVRAVRQPRNSVIVDEASVVMIEDGKRYRLPKNDAYGTSVEMAAEAAAPGESLADFLPQSLALGATVSVSGTHGGYAPGNAVDGRIDDENARWIGLEKSSGWIEIDLGAAKTIGNLWVVSGWQKSPQYVVRDFDVQIKVGETWETLPQGEIRGNDEVEFELHLAKPVTARHVRVISKKPGFLRLYEIAMFEKRPPLPAPGFRGFGPARICREVATERDLLNVQGSFYELPAHNAQGMAKIRPIATHDLAIQDFCSHSGLLFFTGMDDKTESEHVFRSDDGLAAVWAGVIDDLWQLGKPRGQGGPWKNSPVKAGEPSDPYLMTGYDRKSVTLTSTEATTLHLEIDVDGTGLWIPYQSFPLTAGTPLEHDFPEGFSAYWVRARSDKDSTATVTFRYE